MRQFLFVTIVFMFYGGAFSQEVALVKYLPKGYVKDGSRDYTVYIQKGLDENLKVEFPDFPILVNEKGLYVHSNQTLIFTKNASLVMKPNAEEKYGILNVIFVNNVTINNPVLVGDKQYHKGESGEWGMGINIRSSTNIKINNPKISKTWGDGIYIGEPSALEKKDKKSTSYTNKAISVKGGIIDDCLRNGISIISGIDITIDGTIIQNMNSKAPKGAIDIEPNNKSNALKNIILKNITTKNNFNGLIVFLVNLAQEKKYDIGTISIINHKDYNSAAPLVIRNYHKKYRKEKNIQGVKGKIIIKDSFYYNSGNAYQHHPDIDFNPEIEFSNVNYFKLVKGKYIKDNSKENKFIKSVKDDRNVRIFE